MYADRQTKTDGQIDHKILLLDKEIYLFMKSIWFHSTWIKIFTKFTKLYFSYQNDPCIIITND